MGALRYAAIRGMFELLAATRATGLVRRLSKARGIIFTLHRVLPEPPAAFAPNAILQVTPDFLDHAIGRVRALGFDIVDLDEAVRRLRANEPGRRFAAFTFDDAYRDNLVHALPVLRKHECPFTLYVPTALVDGVGEVWWQALEDIVAANRSIAFSSGGERRVLATATLAEKSAAYAGIYSAMRKMPEKERVALIRNLANRYGLDLKAHCRALIMDWKELATFAAEPLCSIGAHTVHHYELAKLSEREARQEMASSRDVIETRLGVRLAHLSYPIGGASSAGPREYAMAEALGFRTAVTTIPGGLYAKNAGALTALPRVSLNGLYQARRYVDVFATPAVFTAMGR
jgi:peptidoglycan/xylan/chitin deacetylase (PgdA/CDA1 family)